MIGPSSSSSSCGGGSSSQGCKFSENLTFPQFFRKFPEIVAKAMKFSFEFVDILVSRAKTSFLNIMHKVKTQRFGDLFVKNMLIIYFIWL